MDYGLMNPTQPGMGTLAAPPVNPLSLGAMGAPGIDHPGLQGLTQLLAQQFPQLGADQHQAIAAQFLQAGQPNGMAPQNAPPVANLTFGPGTGAPVPQVGPTDAMKERLYHNDQPDDTEMYRRNLQAAQRGGLGEPAVDPWGTAAMNQSMGVLNQPQAPTTIQQILDLAAGRGTAI